MCLIYSAFFPGSGLLDVVVTDGRHSDDASVGFTSQGLTYLSSISIALITPPIISVIGVRATFGIASILYCGLFIGIIFLQDWTIYLGSFIAGVGMGMLWVVAPKILTDNSTEKNLQRNNSIWWCIYIFSMVIGNTADYFYLGNLTTIDAHTRFCIYLVCTILVLLATAVAILGYKDVKKSESLTDNQDELLCSRSIQGRPINLERATPWEKIKQNMKLYKVCLFRKEVGYLLLVLFYNSFVLAFYTMTYQTCIGHTFADRSLIPLMSLVFGMTAVISCPLYESMATFLNTKIAVLFLYVLAIISYYMIFLSFPSAATYGSSDEPTTIKPTKNLVLIIGVLLAITDTGFNIQANHVVGLLFQSDSEIGFMLLNSVMSLGTAIVFFLCSYISLYALLALLVVFCTVATICITVDIFKLGL
ncbi:hypothetical protein ACHWQZ_G002881 [Mnemiopsis leidyi]